MPAPGCSLPTIVMASHQEEVIPRARWVHLMGSRHWQNTRHAKDVGCPGVKAATAMGTGY